MLLVEEKRIPVRISLVNMRAYGDKPEDFLRRVPGGLLPALEMADTGQVITESQVIMELLDDWHPAEDGYRPMLPSPDDAPAVGRYERLARLEREYVWFCSGEAAPLRT
jgi:glutathione S-transferase